MTTVHSVWSFGYRARSAYASDSDSVDDDATTAVDTIEACSMRAMDLSSRHETVEYRPNPWSIARINAASRPSKPALPPTLGAPQSKPIVEAFKKQAKRGQGRVQPIVRDATNLGNKSVRVPGVDERAKRSRQGCERPQRSPPHKPQIGSTFRAGEKEKYAHISTFSDGVSHSGSPPFKPKRIPVRPDAPLSDPELGYHAVRDHPMFRCSSPGPRSHASVSAHIVSPSSPPRASVPACARSRSTEVGGDLLPASLPPRDKRQGMAPNWLLDALDEGICVSPSSPPRQDTTDSHICAPQPKRKRLASPEPQRDKPRASALRPPDPVPPAASASRHLPTAYAFGEGDDPDGEWSTLAKPKRRGPTTAKRVVKPSGIRQSGGFRLPLLGLAPKTPTRAPEARRRVITYLPPPIASMKQVDEVTAKIGPSSRGPTKYSRIEEEEEIRVMDSDVTLVNEGEDEEHVIGIDVDDIRVRYPAIRACMKAENRIRKALGCVVELRV